jgi:hypothetical protein
VQQKASEPSSLLGAWWRVGLGFTLDGFAQPGLS